MRTRARSTLRVVFALPTAMAFAASEARGQTEEVRVRAEAPGDFASRADERTSVREVTDAGSLVEPLPGVHVRRFGGDDSFTTLSIRGSSSNEVSVILAGVPLTGGADPTLDLATLPLWPGAVARVHRSFAPAALGPGSLGGTLVLEPPKPTSPPTTDVWAAAGSFGELRTRVGDVRDVGGGSRLVSAVSASRSDDDFTYLDPIASASGRDVYARRQNAGHAAANALVAWALPVTWSSTAPRGALAVTALAQARTQELPGTIIGPTPFASLRSDRALASADLSGPAAGGAWSFRGWGRREGLHLRDAVASDALGPSRADDAIVAAGGSAGWRGRPGGDTLVEARLDGSGERFEPGPRQGAPPPPGATRASAGGALDVEWRAAPEVALAGSARLDAWRDDAADGTRDSELRPTGHAGFEAPVGPVVAAAHGGATARPPSFVERYGDRGAFIGDPALRPESAWTVDAGVRASRRLGVDARVAFEAVGFATWAQDLIAFVPVGAYGRAKATNIGRARLLGAELDARAGAGPIEVRASYAWLTTADEAACAGTAGECERPPLPARPENDLVVDAVGRSGPVQLRVGLDVLSGMAADLTGNVTVPPRGLVSVGVRVEPCRGVRLAVDVRNLFDVRTGTYDGALGPIREPIGDSYLYPLPGRTLLVSARFTSGGGEP
ncbi:MAG TPA: TonB-dependent receptor [Polyangiaceae bacterium]|nr:TonB-dependent receptor [Polyangiaceae bacterium]